MSFPTRVKNNQSRRLAKTWRDALITRNIERGSYGATGKVKEARAFAAAILQETIVPSVKEAPRIARVEPIVVFSRDDTETAYWKQLARSL